MKTIIAQKKAISTKLNYNSRIIKTIIAAIQEKKGANIISLNLKKIPEAVTDFFIICEANNSLLLQAIANNIEKKVFELCNEKPFKFENKQGDKWVLIDYINIVVHCMHTEARHYYQIEELWHDAEKKEIN